MHILPTLCATYTFIVRRLEVADVLFSFWPEYRLNNFNISYVGIASRMAVLGIVVQHALVAVVGVYSLVTGHLWPRRVYQRCSIVALIVQYTPRISPFISFYKVVLLCLRSQLFHFITQQTMAVNMSVVDGSCTDALSASSSPLV